MTKLELQTALGSVYRDVLPYPPRDCYSEEIPIIDIAPIFSEDIAGRRLVASQIRAAAVNMGFFYIKNHGISEETILKCKNQCLDFFKQTAEKKDLVSNRFSAFFNGYTGNKSTLISPSEGIDVRESFAFRYRPEMEGKDPNTVPSEVRPYIRGEDFVWEGTSHLPNFKEDVLAYWLGCLKLARKLVRTFALSLDLPEDYWDDKVTYPGADAVYNYYPARTAEEAKEKFVNLGSHTDLQLFTLLWQDRVGGLQVLNPQGQWIKALPVDGTLVVNIGDFMMRLCNDIYKSTVHRVYNESQEERVSMPFFFGEPFYLCTTNGVTR
jgi:isopenicillin N synthase-like dioxygenase